jgi:hypothetical protein
LHQSTYTHDNNLNLISEKYRSANDSSPLLTQQNVFRQFSITHGGCVIKFSYFVNIFQTLCEQTNLLIVLVCNIFVVLIKANEHKIDNFQKAQYAHADEKAVYTTQ